MWALPCCSLVTDVEEVKRALQEQLKKNEEEMEQMNKSWQQRLEEAQAVNQVW